MNDVFIVDQIGEVVERVNQGLYLLGFQHLPVYYMYGHPMEISSRLQELSNSPNNQHQKFPLIILFTDITISKDVPGFYGSASLRMLIANMTDPNYISVERTENNFKPILHPIKNELINQISDYEGFTYRAELTYDETDMYYYGSQINNKNIFNDYIDAIELKNIKVNIKNKIC
jgi:hypothetical protein